MVSIESRANYAKQMCVYQQREPLQLQHHANFYQLFVVTSSSKHCPEEHKDHSNYSGFRIDTVVASTCFWLGIGTSGSLLCTQ
jgi:hypothetical protein